MNQLSTSRIKPGPYFLTASGIKFDLLNPDPDTVNLRDIACSLSRIPRFNGQFEERHDGYSVAQHSLMVAANVPPGFRLAALLHDAHEAYLGDWTTPLKRALAIMSPVAHAALQELEGRITKAIRQHFGLNWFVHADVARAIKRADDRALVTEKQAIMASDDDNWGISLPPFMEVINPLPAAAARDLFIAAVQAELQKEDFGDG